MILWDYIIIAVILGGLGLLNLHFARRASRGMGEFILGGGRMPWWLAGASVIATGINTSTPLADGRKIRNDGISGQWFGWQAVIANAITAVWFGRLWRRAGITTPLEFYAIRYGSRPATAARIMDVCSLGVFNAIIWTTTGLLGFRKLATVLFGLPPTTSLMGYTIATDWLLIIAAVIVAMAYSTAAGVYSVVWTDMLELVLTLACSYWLFFSVFADVGWNVGLRDRIAGLGAEGDRILHMLPELGPALIVLFFLQPLISQGQWTPSVQRYLCVKDEREVLTTAYFSQIVNFVFRPWPFLILGLAGMFLVSSEHLLATYPPISSPNGAKVPDYEMVFPSLALMYLPHGVLGLLMAGFIISFMGSLASNVHSNSALFVNDLYRPFLVKNASPRHYVWAVRLYMVFLTGTSIVLSMVFDNILSLVVIAMTVTNASGIVKALRFLWWRVNGWAELSATIAGLASAAFFYSPPGARFIRQVAGWFNQQSNDAFYALPVMLMVVLSTTACLAAIALTRPEPLEKLCEFYRRVRPYGWWGPVAGRCPRHRHGDPIGMLWCMTGAFLLYVFGGIFAAIGLLLAFWWLAIAGVAACLGGYWYLRRALNRLYPRTPAEARQPAAEVAAV